MAPDDMQLPDLSNLRFGLQGLPTRLERVLWVIDPPRLRQIDERVRDAIVNEHITAEIRSAELEIQRLQTEVTAMKNIQARLQR